MSYSDVKSGENFYFVDDLQETDEFGRDFFAKFDEFVSQMQIASNENAFYQPSVNVTSNAEEENLHE